MIWPLEVQRTAEAILPVYDLTQAEQALIMLDINRRLLNRESSRQVSRAAHALARRSEIMSSRPDAKDGLVVVGFAGGGGSCEGIKQALGYAPHIAMNHNPVAMAMHAVNHPETLHYAEDIFSVDPVISTGGLPVTLGWFSPDCRHFSKAKGSKPVEKKIRGLAWVVLRWALAVRPRVLMLENVEEFRTWGPLISDSHGHQIPDPSRAGETFKAFVSMLSTGIPSDHAALEEVCEFLKISVDSEDAARLVMGLGYRVDSDLLRACDYGAPTIRRRLFLVARCDGLPVAWPKVSHADPQSKSFAESGLKPWRTAAECIDWSLPCPSIFERKKPLAENTLKRIARGIQRFVIDNPRPFIVGAGGSAYQGKPRTVEAPFHTVMKESHSALITPALVQTGYGERAGQSPRALDIEKPLGTVVAGGGKHALVAPIIARIGQTGFGGDHMAYEAGKPLTTVTSKAEHLLVAPLITRCFGQSIGHSVNDPNGTITPGGGGKSQLTTAFLAKHFGGNYTGPGLNADSPVHAVTTTDHHALVTSNLIMLRGTCRDGQEVTKPVPAITSGGLHIGEVRAFLLKYYGNEKDGCELTDPLHTVTQNDRFGLVTVEGVDYQIVDIGMRMLQPHELYAAQGFPKDYIIDKDASGKKWPKSEQVARCGNAVPPPFAKALVEANLPELCAAF